MLIPASTTVQTVALKMRCPIFMQNGDLFGFVGVDFAEHLSQEHLVQATESAKSSATKISGLFAPQR